MDLHDVGSYGGKVVDAGTNSINGSDYIYFTCDISGINVDGDYKTLDVPIIDDVKMFLTEKALPHTEEKLFKMGFNGDYKNPRLSDVFYESVWINNSHSKHKDKTYNSWEFDGFGGFEKEALPDSRLEVLTARFKQMQAAQKTPIGAPPTSTPGSNGQPEAPAPTGDETPF